ncbi:bifunctional 3'-5' exonuclease/DNA polymerase [Desulforamulus hydrothermalis]|uniref:DNA polymerase I n=1 Tax=Desulforamulus hydrothermalis Lam5 = DSM 18033 TaxID=1121428 RepID=K8DWR9_9FIRM|nr:bifunctional 3'-5' exonuclease/DNA polymerase [Desulforamulus hydrothermalis]CCO06882.1 DNA polymerase I family protein with 3'-5'-exonuclease and polymerase domains [Desulforamulus hydrothermalis Lam5 = DSM 18033]SHH47581.1 DNA polymerase-1 [Desulforamulus hydrothermalis Lam5 = DSM 18033]
MGYKCVYMLSEIKEYLKNTVLFAFDFETSPRDKWRNDKSAALDAHKADITGISFSVSEGTAIYVPLKHRSGRNAENQAAIWDYLKLLFESKDVIKVAHNLAFESMFLYARGIVLQKPCYDTIAASQLTLKSKWEFRSLADSGLKTLAPALCKAEMTEFSTVTDGRFFDELNPQDEKTVRYACADSDYTLRLYHVFNQWFDRFLPKHRTIVEEVESPTSVYVGIMKYNGILVDKSAMLKKQAEAAEKIVSIRKEIAGIIGNVEIGANASTSAFKKYLFVDLGLPVMKTTAKHQEAADDETMILLKEWCESNRPELARLFELVQEYRKWGKLKSTYIDGYLRFIDEDTGRIHPDLMPLGTETGRFASRNPNMQNCPQKDNDPIGIRKFIISPAGKVLLSLDFSQIELRVGAFYCRDKRMLETYRTGGDIHAQTTSVIYRIPFEEAADKNAPHYKERRTIAKNCNFGVFYGLFPTGLQRTLKFKAGLNPTLSECETIIQNLKAGYPGLAKWQDEVKKRAAVSCYTETWLGRRRYLLGIRSSDWGKKSFAERCALNTPIQGTAADILKLACGRIISGLPERLWLKPILQIHDELVFELPEDKVDEAVALIKECMETQPFPEFDVPIVAEASVGRNFGEMKEMED